MAKSDEDTITKTQLVVPTETYVKLVLLIVGTILLLAVLRITAHALVLLFIAFFLALALNAPVAFVARHIPGKAKGNRAAATSIAFLIVVLILAAFIASLAPPLIRSSQGLINSAPHLIENIRDQKGTAGDFIRHYHLQDQVGKLSTQLSERLQAGTGQAFDTVQKIGSSIFAVVTILALTFMMLVEGPRRIEFLHELLPQRHKKMAQRVTANMYRVVKGYVNGQVTLAAIASAFIFIGLEVGHVSYVFALVGVVFICGLIPMVGHTIGAVIVSIVAAFHSFNTALFILLYYITYQQIENYLIQPRIQANSTDMSPLLVFGSVVIGVSFSGLLGGLLAIPVAGCIRVVALEYLRSRRLVAAPIIKEEIREASGNAK